MARGRSPRWKRNRKFKCVCGGYHFPHRRGGGACIHSPRAVYHYLIRDGDSHEDAVAGWAWLTPGKPATDCPF